MRVAVFHKDVRIIGVLVLEPGLSLTYEQTERLSAKGIGVLYWHSPLAQSDGNVNQFVDTLLEKLAEGKVGAEGSYGNIGPTICKNKST